MTVSDDFRPPGDTVMNRPGVPSPSDPVKYGLHPAIRASMEEALFGKQGMLNSWPRVEHLVREFADSPDPAIRRQSLFFRLWWSDNTLSGEELERNFELLTREAIEVGAEGYVDPLAELLIARVLSDSWLERAHFDRAAAFLAASTHWAKVLELHEVHVGALASLGFVLTLAGYVDEGLGVITRCAARTIDCSTHSFIGSGNRLRQERHQVVELADADEHTRNFARAAAGFQMVTSLLGPEEGPARLNSYWALVRCLTRIGKVETAAEIFDDIAVGPRPTEYLLWVKHARTVTVMQAALGNVAEALEFCASSLESARRSRSVGLHSELLLDGSSIARAADEPRWILDHVKPGDYNKPDGISLAGTFAFRDLAWAHRRVGQRDSAARCHQLALLGQQRFAARSGYSPFGPDAPPGVLKSSRELHRRAERSRSKERQSLQRGIGSIVHDVRNQLQSLEFLTGVGGCDSTETLTVRSIVTAVDDMLSDLLRDVEADREIELTDVCLTDVVFDVLDRFRSNASHKNIELLCDLKRAYYCQSDPLALDRIVSNLVSNAIKYSPNGGSVRVTATTLGEAFVDLHVVDSGPGIPSDEVDDLFRWGGTLSSKPTGGETRQGIGLFTAQRLARLTGANIQPHPRTQSSPSTMSVRLKRSR